jgi:hypothetical protein
MARTPRRSYPAVTTAYFTAEQDKALRAFAKATDRDVAEIIRSAVETYLVGQSGRGRGSAPDRDTRRYTGARVKPLRFWRPPWGW